MNSRATPIVPTPAPDSRRLGLQRLAAKLLGGYKVVYGLRREADFSTWPQARYAALACEVEEVASPAADSGGGFIGRDCERGTPVSGEMKPADCFRAFFSVHFNTIPALPCVPMGAEWSPPRSARGSKNLASDEVPALGSATTDCIVWF